MKKTIYLFILLFITSQSFANNLVIGSTSYVSGTNTISFSIKWDNSWRVNGSQGPNNWDAVWIFVKRQPCAANGIWSHAKLSTTRADHTITAPNSYNLIIDPVSDGMGVFIHRDQSANNQIGNLTNATNVSLKLSGTYNPALVGSSTNADNFKVIGIEMVYVPTGNFYIGDGRSTNTSNFSRGNSIGAKEITSAIQSSGLGSYINYTNNPTYGCVIPLPSTFPLGYDGFYCMKYEINQQQILDYLNSLTYDQQAGRLSVWGRVPTANNYWSNNQHRQFIRVLTSGTNNSVPAVFDFAGNAWCAYLPSGFMNWQDLTSYLDWSGLRPMTEFEYEKACRGTLNPVQYEYPWGNNSTLNMINGTGTNGNTATEFYNGILDGMVHANWDAGPARAGFAATANTNRVQSGATFYGILDMAGNVWEQCVGGGTGYNYSTFTTENGDGALSKNGRADVTGWPTDGGVASGTILKGGGYYNLNNYYNGGAAFQISDRSFYGGTTLNQTTGNTKDRSIGGRGVRNYQP
jgi:formylglycine-generating enzyme required for sulfatase activity